MSQKQTFQYHYLNMAALAKFYNVSADYLFGVTNNHQHRNVEIDTLSLSDGASELLSHPDFQQLINAIEVYIDKKILPQMNTINTIYRLAETSIKEECAIDDMRDEVLSFLQNSVIDEDEYLRFRISERFNTIMKNLSEAHKKTPPQSNR